MIDRFPTSGTFTVKFELALQYEPSACEVLASG